MSFRYPFEVTVYIYRRPHMRDESLEYELDMGRLHLNNIFDEEKVDEKTTELFFSFPERWMNIVEERSLFSRIQLLYPNLKKLTIKTQSVYIIQSTPAGQCHIVSGKEEREYCEKHGNLPQEQKTGKMWFPNPGNLVNAHALNVLNGK
jgi:hypothetical protein